jgi:hypothetical protein
VQGWLGFFMLPPRNKTNSPGAAQRVARMARKHKRKAGSFPTFCGKSMLPSRSRATVGTAQCNSCVG